MAALRETDGSSTVRLSVVLLRKSGIKATNDNDLGNRILEASTFQLSVTASWQPPRRAGVTLSGCPSIEVAMLSRWFLENGFPVISFAATRPATIAAELLPRPRARGILLVQVTLRGGISRRASENIVSIARRITLSFDGVIKSSPSPLSSKPGDPSSTVIEQRSSNANPIASNPDPRLAVLAGTVTVTLF